MNKPPIDKPEQFHQVATRDQADRDWMRHALCKNHDPELWFTTNGETYRRQQMRKAKQICAACPVRLRCLQYAVDTDSRFGVFGGVTGFERTRITGRRTWG